MSVPTELTAAICTAIRPFLPTGTTAVGDGVDDGAAGKDEPVFPIIAVRVSECSPMGYKSTVRSYPVLIEAATHHQADPSQATLYAIGQIVSLWICSGPSLTIASATFDALYFDAPPERDNDGRVQYFQWAGLAHVHAVTATNTTTTT